MRLLFVILRVVVAAAITVAIVAQLAHSLSFLQGTTGFDAGFYITNFFSFFTVDSNAASVVVLLVGAGLAIRRSGPDPLLFTTVRACVVTYMVTTGIVYNLLLRGIALPQGQTLEWSNEILHVVGPIYLLLDWLFAPGRIPLNYRRLWAIVSFPIAWVIYTLIRGPLAIDGTTGKPWYPYPFLNPTLSANGYFSVAFYVLLIALVICAIGVGVIWVSRRSISTRT
ncbi:Pr6Pr family membrane protein [Subtercola endophyticus]|uniref:Pr6Pr family membrane protein n=1 Tax=Subtercola endophyticus TaxID=2895559 RepID=UPI001E3A3D73|nr:Pr6Pr family membrane protein [Subtercola endophyticus]UFS59739.1 Pr6Pr family membrane protein [Subtercola endophyticus]